jgi:deoxyribose-phosphate aldolase
MGVSRETHGTYLTDFSRRVPGCASLLAVLPYNCVRNGLGTSVSAGGGRGNRGIGWDHPMAVEKNQRYGIAEGGAQISAEGLTTPGHGPIATLGGRPLLSNRGIPLNLDWVKQVRVNTSAVERRAQSHVLRRTVKKDWQVAWLLRAITCMDLTTLSGDDTDERVRRLCAKARHPLSQELTKRLAIEDLNIQVAAVCVYHRFVETARRALEGTGVRVAAVSTGFPAGLSPLEDRVDEIRRSVAAGAQDIDVVITRAHVFGGRWQELFDEISAFKQASGSAHMKVILGTGDLLTLRNVGRASVVAMMAGADFIKTSTGKESTNATLPVGFVMTRAIREYAQETGMAVGFKPAGGIRTAKQSTEWLALMKEELGVDWMKAELFRFGASGLLNDIERQLEFHATGRYSADYRHPIA